LCCHGAEALAAPSQRLGREELACHDHGHHDHVHERDHLDLVLCLLAIVAQTSRKKGKNFFRMSKRKKIKTE
jgi:hypothetical protein